jgi:hypothetical protein
MTGISTNHWSFLRIALNTDEHGGAVHIREHLELAKVAIESSPMGIMLVIEDEEQPGRFVGASGLTMGCGVVHVHFLYVIPEERNTEVFFSLVDTVKAFGQANHYGYVVMECPMVSELDSLHSCLQDISCGFEKVKTSLGVQVVRYCVPKDAWELTF